MPFMSNATALDNNRNNNNKKYMMIHHVTPEVINVIDNLNPREWILTFDDNLYSVFHYRRLLSNEFEKILFVTPMLVNEGNEFKIYATCQDAMYWHFEKNDNSCYMNLSQIKYLSSEYEFNFEIGYHGYSHDVILHGLSDNVKSSQWRYYKYPQLKGIEKYFKVDSCLSAKGYKIIENEDNDNNDISFIEYSKEEYELRVINEIDKMVQWFSNNSIYPTIMAYPFNSTSSYLDYYLGLKGIITVPDRVDIADYIHNYYGKNDNGY